MVYRKQIIRIYTNNEMNQERYRIGKVYISITTPKDAEGRITQATLNGENGYICVSNMRTVVLANENERYCKLMNEAYMCLLE